MTQSQRNLRFDPEQSEVLPLAHARRPPVAPPLALALLGGGIIGYGLWRRGIVGTVVTAAGVGVAAAAYERLRARVIPPLEVFRAVTIDAGPEELFSRWMDLANLPTFMQHLERVEVLGPNRSRWTARAMGKMPSISWEAELVDVKDNQLVHWRSLPNAAVHNEGTVTFVPAPGGRGTEVHVRIIYRPPGGTLARAAAATLRRVFSQQVKEDLRRFKRLVEIGELPSVEGQPHGVR